MSLVGKVESLWRYPVKSMRGEELEEAFFAYLVKALHPDIHIEYPSPEGFAPEYSTGVGTRWLLKLGTFSQRLAALEEVASRSGLAQSAPN
jgi:hypothetical protein